MNYLDKNIQRLAFEAQEALPDYGMSSRLMKRLVEANLINGQYEVHVHTFRLWMFPYLA